MDKVGFLIIGAQKAGTSWLYHNLKGHPDLDMSKQKEVHFFDKDRKYKKGYEYYHSYFKNNNKLKGEVTPNYILFRNTLERIYNYNPYIKSILILRDSTERAISCYKMNYKRGHKMSLLELFNENVENIQEAGLYEKQINNYLNFFSREKLLVLDFNDIKNNPYNLLRKIFYFLNISEVFNDNVEKTIFKGSDDINYSQEDVDVIKEFYKDVDYTKFLD